MTFTTITDGNTVDWLAAGASLRITLAPNGTTSGRLIIPGGDEDGGDLDEDLSGTWTLEDGTIRFSQSADTFMRDMPFTIGDGRLSGDRTFGDVRIQVVLLKE